MHSLIVFLVAIVISSAVDPHSGRRCGWNLDGLKQETEFPPGTFHRAVHDGDSELVTEWRRSDGPIKDERVAL